MRKVSREEVRKPAEYAALREEFRRAVLEQKDKRRVHVGSFLTFLFENHDTVLYQIQEMLRATQNVGKFRCEHADFFGCDLFFDQSRQNIEFARNLSGLALNVRFRHGRLRLG